jgi:TonB family protein
MFSSRFALAAIVAAIGSTLLLSHPAFADRVKGLATHVKFPVIPPEARGRHLSGSGVILVYIRPDGSVERAEVAQSSGHKILDDAALAAFSQWQFIPGRLKKVKIPFTFSGNYERPKNI